MVFAPLLITISFDSLMKIKCLEKMTFLENMVCFPKNDHIVLLTLTTTDSRVKCITQVE